LSAVPAAHQIARFQIGDTVTSDHDGEALLDINEYRRRDREADDGAYQNAESFPAPSCSETCLWCGKALIQAQRRGSPKRFCCAGHRNAFWTAARRWVMRAVEAGLLPPQALKAHQQSVHAFGERF